VEAKVLYSEAEMNATEANISAKKFTSVTFTGSRLGSVGAR